MQKGLPLRSILAEGGQIIIWVVVGALIVIIASGAYYLGKSSTPKPSPNPVVTPSSQPTPSPSDASPAPNGMGETTNWKTYTNTKYGYSVKYPNSWIVVEAAQITNLYPSRVPAEILKQLQQREPFTEPTIDIYILDTAFSKSEALTGDPRLFIIKPQTINVSGRSGYYYQVLCAPSCGIYYDLPYNDGNQILRISVGSPGKENTDSINKEFNLQIQDINENTFKEIISTFKFLQ